MKRLQLACIALLFLFLTSCGMLGQTPPNQAIELAIAQQQTNIRQNIAQGLGIPSQAEPTLKFKIDDLNVEKRHKLSTQPSTGYPDTIYQVRGTFNATLTTSSQTTRQASPFEVYLGTNPQPNSDNNTSEPETWYLIPPAALKPLQ